ncbi:Transmembrane protein 42 [Trichoplax sp. H2]|nr:Transmembrane protein 42 [Trichoplax sp. H2]|eukprot:RDD40071.1 Transmembrane protein 42 [Trichoplax sp. H2]
MLGFLLASLAGLSAAFASMFMKLAFYDDHIMKDYLCTAWIEISSKNCTKIWWCLRAICIGGFFLSNAIMWTFFVKALNQFRTSLQATVISSAINFIASALLGYVIFKEYLSKMWCLGAFLMIVGLGIIHSDRCHVETKETRVHID